MYLKLYKFNFCKRFSKKEDLTPKNAIDIYFLKKYEQFSKKSRKINNTGKTNKT